ncbi:MAG: Tetraacyldisaccharide 4'-kinase [Hyphomicrobiaceae bacterium hypho_1]
MPFREPSWWYNEKNSLTASVLEPVSNIYGFISKRRMLQSIDRKITLPIICVGNFTAGGTGKTPLTILLSKIVRELGGQPVFLSRGYGGRLKYPHQVILQRDTARDVGDEPLLLAKYAKVVVSRDRVLGAELIRNDKLGNVIIMDDGLQHPRLHKDLVVAVIDGKRGIGNGLTIPAGPLRAPVGVQLSFTHALVVYGKPSPDTASFLKPLRQPIFKASIKPVGNLEWITKKPLLAFSGIGNPKRFYDLLKTLGGSLMEARSFSDHHLYTIKDTKSLIIRAESLGAQLVTTEKDLARFDSELSDSHHHIREIVKVLKIDTQFSQAETSVLKTLVMKAIT